MRRRFAEAGLPSPPFMIITGVSGLEELTPSAYELGFPAVVKPVDNMGGRGCRRVDNHDELREAAAEALGFSRSGRAIVEEYMEGPEFSVDAVIYRGAITICGLADRHIFFPPYFIEMGHTMPTNLPQTDQDALIEVFIRGIKALGITDGAAKGDIKRTPRGPMIGEIAARLSGGYMSGWTYPYASGVNPVRGALCAALGRPPEGLVPEKHWTSAERAFISIPGRVHSLVGLEAARKIPGIRDVFIRSEPGSRVRFPENNVSKAGNVISAAADRKTAAESAETAARTILIRLEAPDPETSAFLESTAAFPPPAFTADGELRTVLEDLPETAVYSRAGTTGIIPFPAFMNSNLTDYLGRTPEESLEAVRKLTGLALPPFAGEKTGILLGREFWTALLRGGYQGGTYYITDLWEPGS
jgi:biotin carboxylase